MLQSISASINTGNDVAVYSVMDSGLVYVVDTKYGPGMMDEMKRRAKFGNEVLILVVYQGIVIYNGKMGGVDAWDAVLLFCC